MNSSLSNIGKVTAGHVKTTGVSSVQELEIQLVYPNPYQPRKFFDEEKLQELANSISNNGLLQPIVVQKIDGRYMIIAGERRYKAHLLNKFKTIKALIQNGIDEIKVKEQALVENIQRDDLTDFEIATFITELWNDGGYERKQDLANALGKKPAYISKALGLVDKLDESIKEDITSSNCTMGLSVLEELSRVKEKEVQKVLYKKLVNKEITRNQIGFKVYEVQEDLQKKGIIPVDTKLGFNFNVWIKRGFNQLGWQWILEKLEEDENYTCDIKQVKSGTVKDINENGKIVIVLNATSILTSTLADIGESWKRVANTMTIDATYTFTIKPTGTKTRNIFKKVEQNIEGKSFTKTDLESFKQKDLPLISEKEDETFTGESQKERITRIESLAIHVSSKLYDFDNMNILDTSKSIIFTLANDYEKALLESEVDRLKWLDNTDILEEELKKLEPTKQQNENDLTFTDIDYKTLIDFVNPFTQSLQNNDDIDEQTKAQILAHFHQKQNNKFKITIEEL